MDYTSILRQEVKQFGPKAIVFASDLTKPIQSAHFRVPEFMFMKQVEQATLDRLIQQSFQDSKRAFRQIVSASSSTRKK
jgi:hypothetical protein